MMAFCGMALGISAENIVFTHANWMVTYVESTHAFRMQAMVGNSGSYQPAITNSIPEATYTDQADLTHTVSTLTLQNVSYTAKPIEDSEFGKDVCHKFKFTAMDLYGSERRTG